MGKGMQDDGLEIKFEDDIWYKIIEYNQEYLVSGKFMSIAHKLMVAEREFYRKMPLFKPSVIGVDTSSLVDLTSARFYENDRFGVMKIDWVTAYLFIATGTDYTERNPIELKEEEVAKGKADKILNKIKMIHNIAGLVANGDELLCIGNNNIKIAEMADVLHQSKLRLSSGQNVSIKAWYVEDLEIELKAKVAETPTIVLGAKFLHDGIFKGCNIHFTEDCLLSDCQFNGCSLTFEKSAILGFCYMEGVEVTFCDKYKNHHTYIKGNIHEDGADA